MDGKKQLKKQKITMNINIDTFDTWAIKDRDESMAAGHYPSVTMMLDLIKKNTSIMNKPFSFIDLGCGNGWVIREILKDDKCSKGFGIDGSENMIKKAEKHNIGTFKQYDIENYKFTEKFDIVFSMETFYYFNNPQMVINNIYNNALKDKGILIIGIDHYMENKTTLSWGDDYNLKLNTLSMTEWKEKFNLAGFSKVISNTVNKKEEWSGTFILLGFK